MSAPLLPNYVTRGKLFSSLGLTGFISNMNILGLFIYLFEF